jgi:hypothetical protein
MLPRDGDPVVVPSIKYTLGPRTQVTTATPNYDYYTLTVNLDGVAGFNEKFTEVYVSKVDGATLPTSNPVMDNQRWYVRTEFGAIPHLFIADKEITDTDNEDIPYNAAAYNSATGTGAIIWFTDDIINNSYNYDSLRYILVANPQDCFQFRTGSYGGTVITPTIPYAVTSIVGGSTISPPAPWKAGISYNELGSLTEYFITLGCANIFTDAWGFGNAIGTQIASFTTNEKATFDLKFNVTGVLDDDLDLVIGNVTSGSGTPIINPEVNTSGNYIIYKVPEFTNYSFQLATTGFNAKYIYAGSHPITSATYTNGLSSGNSFLGYLSTTSSPTYSLPGAQVIANMQITLAYTPNTYNVYYTATNYTIDDIDNGDEITYGTNVSGTIIPNSYYKITDVSVTRGGSPLSSPGDYTYNNATGAITINGSAIIGDITINVTTELIPYAITFAVTPTEAGGCDLPGDITAGAGITVDNKVTHGTDAVFTLPDPLTAKYSLDEITITIGGTSYTDFTHDAANRTVTIDGGDITGDIDVTVAYEPAGHEYGWFADYNDTTISITSDDVLFSFDGGTIPTWENWDNTQKKESHYGTEQVFYVKLDDAFAGNIAIDDIAWTTGTAPDYVTNGVGVPNVEGYYVVTLPCDLFVQDIEIAIHIMKSSHDITFAKDPNTSNISDDFVNRNGITGGKVKNGLDADFSVPTNTNYILDNVMYTVGSDTTKYAATDVSANYSPTFAPVYRVDGSNITDNIHVTAYYTAKSYTFSIVSNPTGIVTTEGVDHDTAIADGLTEGKAVYDENIVFTYTLAAGYKLATTNDVVVNIGGSNNTNFTHNTTDKTITIVGDDIVGNIVVTINVVPATYELTLAEVIGTISPSPIGFFRVKSPQTTTMTFGTDHDIEILAGKVTGYNTTLYYQYGGTGDKTPIDISGIDAGGTGWSGTVKIPGSAIIGNITLTLEYSARPTIASITTNSNVGGNLTDGIRYINTSMTGINRYFDVVIQNAGGLTIGTGDFVLSNNITVIAINSPSTGTYRVFFNPPTTYSNVKDGFEIAITGLNRTDIDFLPTTNEKYNYRGAYMANAIMTPAHNANVTDEAGDVIYSVDEKVTGTVTKEAPTGTPTWNLDNFTDANLPGDVTEWTAAYSGAYSDVIEVNPTIALTDKWGNNYTETLEWEFNIVDPTATYAISDDAGSNNAVLSYTGGVTGGTTVTSGTDVTFTVLANTGYTINTVSYTVGGGSATTLAAVAGVYTIDGSAITGDVVISVTTTATTYTISNNAASNNAVLSYTSGVTGTTVTHGTAVTFTVSANTGYTINTVSYTVGGGSSTTLTAVAGVYTIDGSAITGDVVISVTTTANTYTISNNATSNNATLAYTGGVAGTAVTYGTAVTFTASANTGYTINTVSYTVGGGSSTTLTAVAGVYTIDGSAITGNIVISVTTTANTYTISNNAASNNAGLSYNSGVLAGNIVTYGTPVIFTASANTGYTINTVNVTIGGASYSPSVSGNNTYTIPGSAITGNVVISVTTTSITPTTYTIDTNVSNNATFAYTGGVTGGTTVTAGTDVTFTVSANTGYVITNVLVSINSSSYTPSVSGNTYTIAGSAITGDILITVTTTSASSSSNVIINDVVSANVGKTQLDIIVTTSGGANQAIVAVYTTPQAAPSVPTTTGLPSGANTATSITVGSPFVVTWTGLTKNTTYYVYAWATDNGTTWTDYFATTVKTNKFKEGYFESDNSTFGVSDVNPSPADIAATFNLQTSEGGNLNVQVYNLAGNFISNIVENQYISDNTEITIPLNLSKLASGRYNIIVTIGNDRAIRPVIIAK